MEILSICPICPITLGVAMLKNVTSTYSSASSIWVFIGKKKEKEKIIWKEKEKEKII
jgi:hypothetical protein